VAKPSERRPNKVAAAVRRSALRMACWKTGKKNHWRWWNTVRGSPSKKKNGTIKRKPCLHPKEEVRAQKRDGGERGASTSWEGAAALHVQIRNGCSVAKCPERKAWGGSAQQANSAVDRGYRKGKDCCFGVNSTIDMAEIGRMTNRGEAQKKKKEKKHGLIVNPHEAAPKRFYCLGGGNRLGAVPEQNPDKSGGGRGSR